MFEDKFQIHISTDTAMEMVQINWCKNDLLEKKLSMFISEMTSASIIWSLYQFWQCFIHKLLRYSLSKLSAFQRKFLKFEQFDVIIYDVSADFGFLHVDIIVLSYPHMPNFTMI